MIGLARLQWFIWQENNNDIPMFQLAQKPAKPQPRVADSALLIISCKSIGNVNNNLDIDSQVSRQQAHHLSLSRLTNSELSMF